MDPFWTTALASAGVVTKIAFAAGCVAATFTAASKIIRVYYNRYENVKATVEHENSKANYEGLSPEQTERLINKYYREQSKLRK